MELITRALAGVVAVWIPIERHTKPQARSEAEMSVFTTAPKIILLDKKRLEWRKARATPRFVNECGQQKPRRVKPGFFAQ